MKHDENQKGDFYAVYAQEKHYLCPDLIHKSISMKKITALMTMVALVLLMTSCVSTKKIV